MKAKRKRVVIIKRVKLTQDHMNSHLIKVGLRGPEKLELINCAKICSMTIFAVNDPLPRKTFPIKDIKLLNY